MISDYSRVTPRARTGTTGISETYELEIGEGKRSAIWVNIPDRIAAVTVSVHFGEERNGDYPDDEEDKGEFAVECTAEHIDLITGDLAFWDPAEKDSPVYTDGTVLMLANAVTGIRVRYIREPAYSGEDKDKKLYVSFCG